MKIEPLRIHGSCNIFSKKGSKAAYLKDLYEDNKAQQNEVIQLLSMFEVAFTPKQRKNYLFYCLYHLFEDWDRNNYVEFLRKLADKYFFDVYLDASKLNDINQPKPNSFDETIFNNGELNVELEEVNRDFNRIYLSVHAIFLCMYLIIQIISFGRNMLLNCEVTKQRRILVIEKIFSIH